MQIGKQLMFNFSHDFFVFCCYVGELSFGVKELKGVKTTAGQRILMRLPCRKKRIV